MGRLGAYSFEQPLGESPIGLAFAATHVSAPREPGRFELVRIRATLALQPEVEDALRACALSATHVDHANLVKVFEVVADGDEGPYVVSERRPGRTLDDVLEALRAQGRTASRPVALAIAREVLRGLGHLHRAGDGPVIHGGVHPRMVVVDSRGAVRLGGLVAARIIAAASAEEPDLLRGSLGYVAPEVALGDPVDARTDVYAAGVLIYQLCTGVLPPAGVLAPPELDDVVARALRTDPAARYADAAELLEALERVLAHTGAAHVAASDIALFVADVFGEDFAQDAALAAPRMPLAAPPMDVRGRTLVGVPSGEDEPTKVAGHSGGREDTLSRDTDDLLALLGDDAGSNAATHGAGFDGQTTTGADTNVETTTSSDGDYSTEARFTNDGGRTFLPAPATDHTPDVLPQGKIRARSSDPELAAMRLDPRDDPARDSSPSFGTVKVKAIVPPAPAPTPLPSLPQLEPAEPPPPAPAANPIATAMAAARSAAAAPRRPATEPPSGVDLGGSARSERGNPVLLYLTIVALLGAIFALLWFKTDVFHPGRKRARQEERRRQIEEKIKANEAKRPKFGSVVITSVPEQSPVYLLLGRAPAEMPHLDGRVSHTLVVEHEGFQRLVRVVKPEEFKSATDAAAGDTHVARVKAELVAGVGEPGPQPPPVETGEPAGAPVGGTLRVESVPDGAQVWLLVGYTGTMAMDGLPIDVEHQFRVEADGHAPEYVVVKPSDWQGSGTTYHYEAQRMLQQLPPPGKKPR